MKLSISHAARLTAAPLALLLLQPAAPAQTLTPYAIGKGFTLGAWGYGFPSSGGPSMTDIGPTGILPRLDGKVLVSNHNDGTLHLFTLDTPLGDPTGQPASNGILEASYGPGNATGLAAVVSGGTTRYFMTELAAGKVVEITADGVYVQDIAAIPSATGICAFPPKAFFMGTAPHLGHLFVSAPGGIWEVDPNTPGAVPTHFSTVNADGFAFTNSGHYLMTNNFAVIDVLTHAVVFSYVFPTGVSPDGLAIGRGPITGGKAYVNCNNGEVWEVEYDQFPGSGLELDPATPPNVNLIMTGGTRGDFIATDIDVLSGGPVLYWPSLLLSQSTSILRLDPPDSGWFGPPFSMDDGGGGVVQVQCEPGTNGVVACPCGNPAGGQGRGCDNSAATGGARLDWQGVPSLSSDSLVFSTSEQRPAGTSVVLQGTAHSASGLVFGQGVRCPAGSLKRLYVKGAVNGSINAPGPGDPPVSTRSAALGDPIFPGSIRYYMVYYRDPVVLGGCSATSTFNSTQTLSVQWGP